MSRRDDEGPPNLRALIGAVALVAGCDATPAPPARRDAPPRAIATSSPTPIASASPSAEPLLPSTALVRKPLTVLSDPSKGSMEIGLLTIGDRVELAGDAPIAKADCAPGWRKLAPFGFVCAAGDAFGREARAAFVRDHVRAGSPYPVVYGESLGSPVYARIPTEAEQAKAEPGLDAARATMALARRALLVGKDDEVPAALRGVDLTSPADACPAFLGGESPPVAGSSSRGAGVAWIAECEAGDRVYLVTPDLELVPRDRVVRAPANAFHGAESPVGPGDKRVAFVTGRARPRYRMVRYGLFEVIDPPLPLGTAVTLTGQSRSVGGYTYLETTNEGEHVLSEHVAIVQPITRPTGVGATETWLDVDATKGLLVAYQGDTPVYATLAAPPAAVLVDETGARTPTRGRFRVEWKHRLRTFGDGAKTRAFVPHVVTFGGKLALYGDPYRDPIASVASGGGLRVAPIDAEHLFGLLDPGVPEGWSSRKSGGSASGSWIQVR